MFTRSMYFLYVVVIGNTVAQNAPLCSIPEASQFDFWIGQWSLTWDDGKGGTATGTNVIEKILGSCVISENFEDPGSGFAGKSYSLFDQKSGSWKQTWVDNAGSYLDFDGRFADGTMILARSLKTKDGKEIIQRMVWYNILPNSLDWNWEASTDGGKTWKLNWKIHYDRKKD